MILYLYFSPSLYNVLTDACSRRSPAAGGVAWHLETGWVCASFEVAIQTATGNLCIIRIDYISCVITGGLVNSSKGTAHCSYKQPLLRLWGLTKNLFTLYPHKLKEIIDKNVWICNLSAVQGLLRGQSHLVPLHRAKTDFIGLTVKLMEKVDNSVNWMLA